jgi:dTDP-4-amino-4,6-dideoxygalactose transaminase
VFSFHAVKVVTTAEGGIVTTPDPTVAKRLRLLRSHGMTREVSELHSVPEGPWVYEQQMLGFNYRLTDLQAALGRSQLNRLEAMHARRIDHANRYDTLLADLPLILPVRPSDRVSAWHLYVIELDTSRTDRSRAAVFEALRHAQIGVNVHYIPIHMQPHYSKLGFRQGDYPAAELYYSRAISLPLFPGMTEPQQRRVVDTLRAALGA